MDTLSQFYDVRLLRTLFLSRICLEDVAEIDAIE